MTTVAQEPAKKSAVQANARRAVDRMAPTDLGVVIVIIDKDGLPTTAPIGLTWPGRFKALATAVATLADQVPQPAAKTLRSAATQIGNAADKLPPVANG